MKTAWKARLVIVGLVAGVGAAGGCEPAETVDALAADLEVTASFIDVDEGAADDKLPVVVQFFQRGAFVQLAGGTAIDCDGVALTWNGLGYAERVPRVAAGGAYVVSHQRDGELARMTVPALPRPVITSPAQGATATRSATFAIAYPSGGGVARVRPAVSGPAGSQAGEEQPDTGTAIVDASAVGAGDGTVTLTRMVEGSVDGTGFAGAKFVYTIDKEHRVVWQ